MIKYIFIPVVMSYASFLETGWLRATALHRVSSVDGLLIDLSSLVDVQVSKLHVKESISERFDCPRYPPVRAANETDFDSCFREMIHPTTTEVWHTFSEEKRTLLCSVLQQTIKKAKSKLRTESIGIERLRFLSLLYREIASDLDTIDPPVLSDSIVDMLTAGEAYDRYQRVFSNLAGIIHDFRQSPPEEGVGELIWRLADSERLLRDLMAEVFTEGSGEDKVKLFLKKLQKSEKMKRIDIANMARKVLEEFKREIVLLGNRMFNLEKALFIGRADF